MINRVKTYVRGRLTKNSIERRHALQYFAGAVGVVALIAGVVALRSVAELEKIQSVYHEHGKMQKAVSDAISSAGGFRDLPSELTIDGLDHPVIVQYSLDSILQRAMEQLYKEYRPDYGAFVAMDAVTGRVLSLVSYRGPGLAPVVGEDGESHLALRATFPSASVFKVVTAAAVIAEKNFSADTVIPFNGRSHTLYRSNVLKDTHNKWTRYITLKEAFARSINSVFGKIGLFSLNPEQMQDHAHRFGFNRKIAAEFPVQQGKAKLDGDDWERVEAASGFTLENRMSPLQGALIAAAVANDGVMMEPWMVASLHDPNGNRIYEALPQVASEAMDLKTSREIRTLMKATVSGGTSRGSFRGFSRNVAGDVEVGGKTGSLTGDDPPGKYDWFVGYADSGPHRIAVAALTIHEKYWKVKSSYLARRAFEVYLRSKRQDSK